MISRIAVFRALQLGDMLCIIPTIRAIRTAWPGAEIYLVGLPWQEDFVKRFPGYFNHFIEFPGWPGLPEQEPDPERIIGFLKHIRSFQFDIIFQMQGNGEITNSLCMLWRGKTVCGLRKPGEYAPSPDMFPVSEDGEHEILRFFKLLACHRIEPQGTHLEFPIEEDEHNTALKILGKYKLAPDGYICIHPGARDVRRRWSVDHFAFIADYLAARGESLILTGSRDEKDLLHELQQKIHNPVLNIVEAFGHLTSGELAGLLKHSRLLISNDTGVSHIAAGLQIRSVILFSPYSDIARWRPLNSQRHLAITHQQAQDPEFVLEAVLNILGEPARSKDRAGIAEDRNPLPRQWRITPSP